MPSPKFIDDKSPHCIPFILKHLKHHQANNPSSPFIIGLNGIQGSGKTTLVTNLHTTLTQIHSLPTLVFSIDDFYLPHTSQLLLASSHPTNPLLQFRGNPGTHDIDLLTSVFQSLIRNEEVSIPIYDKSAFGGQGDRAPSSHWKTVNKPNEARIQIIIFEGWCVGFRSLPPFSISTIHASPPPGTKTIQNHTLQNLLYINEELGGYGKVNELFDVFIHIDAEELGWVYEWREEQEEVLRRVKGGMTKGEVVAFVDGYFPAYELFMGRVREGVFKGEVGGEGRQLRLVVGRDRRVKKVLEI